MHVYAFTICMKVISSPSPLHPTPLYCKTSTPQRTTNLLHVNARYNGSDLECGF